MKQILETKRLILRELDMNDLDFLMELWSNPLAMRYYPKLYSRKEVQGIIERSMFRYELHGHAFWLMIDKELKKPVGKLGLLKQVVDYKAEPEIGYILHPDHWGKGYATEAAIATRDYAFNTFNYPYVISLIRSVNLPSQAVARRLGMSVWKKAMFANLEHLVFRIDKSDLVNATQPEPEQ